jgi:hypothetical protein
MGNKSLAAGRVLSIKGRGLFTFSGQDSTSYNQIQANDKMGHSLYFLNEKTVFRKEYFKEMISPTDREGPRP